MYLCVPLNNPRDLHLHIAYHYDEMYVNNASPYKPDELPPRICSSPLSLDPSTRNTPLKTTCRFIYLFFTRHYIKRLFGSCLPIYWLKVWEQPIDGSLNRTCMRRMRAYRESVTFHIKGKNAPQRIGLMEIDEITRSSLTTVTRNKWYRRYAFSVGTFLSLASLKLVRGCQNG